MGDRYIKVSARDVLRVLAGDIRPEELFHFGNFNRVPKPEHNYFKKFLDQKFRIVSVGLEESPYDDTDLILEFDGPDPAVSPFVNPKAKPGK